MSDEPQLLYLEPDDEITSVVRRLRQTDAVRVVLVAPGRARATSSAVALRLLARVAGEERRQLAVVGDALTRSLAGEAGLPAYAVVGEAREGLASAPAEQQRARIHVVRGDEATSELLEARPRPRPQPSAEDATRAAAVAVPAAVPRVRRGLGRLGLVALALLLVPLVAAAVVLPAATVAITPEARSLGPFEYAIIEPDPTTESGTLRAAATGTATGTYRDLAPAAGHVILHNYNTVAVEVGEGTELAAGDVVFVTAASVVVQRGMLTPEGRVSSRTAEVPIVAVAPGPAGNLPPGAINVIRNEGVASSLRGFAENQSPLVDQPAPTVGGVDASGPVIEQADVDAVVEQLRSELAEQLEAALAPDDERLYPPAGEAPVPVVEVPEGLVARRDQASFELTASVTYSRPYARRDEVEKAARGRLLADEGAVPVEHDLLPTSIEVALGEARLDGDSLVVDARVTATAMPRVDVEAIRRRVAGMDPDAAHDALAHLGRVEVHLWPAWTEEIPTLDWRIEVSVDELQRAAR